MFSALCLFVLAIVKAFMGIICGDTVKDETFVDVIFAVLIVVTRARGRAGDVFTSITIVIAEAVIILIDTRVVILVALLRTISISPFAFIVAFCALVENTPVVVLLYGHPVFMWFVPLLVCRTRNRNSRRISRAVVTAG